MHEQEAAASPVHDAIVQMSIRMDMARADEEFGHTGIWEDGRESGQRRGAHARADRANHDDRLRRDALHRLARLASTRPRLARPTHFAECSAPDAKTHCTAESGRAERRLSSAIHRVDVRLTGRIPTLPSVGPA